MNAPDDFPQARVLHSIDTADPKALESSLAPLLNPANPYHASATELTVILAAKQGETVRAHQLAEQLIACPSVTPDDAGCQAVIAGRLTPLGFAAETIENGPDHFRVTNLWARRPARSEEHTSELQSH